jgi:hypothetical protein
MTILQGAHSKFSSGKKWGAQPAIWSGFSGCALPIFHEEKAGKKCVRSPTFRVRILNFPRGKNGVRTILYIGAHAWRREILPDASKPVADRANGRARSAARAWRASSALKGLARPRSEPSSPPSRSGYADRIDLDWCARAKLRRDATVGAQSVHRRSVVPVGVPKPACGGLRGTHRAVHPDVARQPRCFSVAQGRARTSARPSTPTRVQMRIGMATKYLSARRPPCERDPRAPPAYPENPHFQFHFDETEPYVPPKPLFR